MRALHSGGFQKLLGTVNIGIFLTTALYKTEDSSGCPFQWDEFCFVEVGSLAFF